MQKDIIWEEMCQGFWGQKKATMSQVKAISRTIPHQQFTRNSIIHPPTMTLTSFQQHRTRSDQCRLTTPPIIVAQFANEQTNDVPFVCIHIRSPFHNIQPREKGKPTWKEQRSERCLSMKQTATYVLMAAIFSLKVFLQR